MRCRAVWQCGPQSVLFRSFVQEKCTKCLFSMAARRLLPARKKRRRPDQAFSLPCKFEPVLSRPQSMLGGADSKLDTCVSGKESDVSTEQEARGAGPLVRDLRRVLDSRIHRAAWIPRQRDDVQMDQGRSAPRPRQGPVPLQADRPEARGDQARRGRRERLLGRQGRRPEPRPGPHLR